MLIKSFVKVDHIRRTSALFSYQVFSALCLYLISGLDCARADSEYETWKQQQSQEFSEFQTEHDRAFLNYLEKQWEEFQVFTGNVRDVVPKIKTPPVVRNDQATTQTAYGKQVNPSKSLVTRTYNTVNEGVGFFGHATSPMTFPVNYQEFIDLSTVNSQRLRKVWEQLSKIDHKSLISLIQQQIKQLELGDWGSVQLIKYQLKQQPFSESQRQAYTWFLLNRLGYDIRAGYTEQEVVLLMPTEQEVFGKDFTVIEGKNFYFDREPLRSTISTYDSTSTPDQQPFNFSLTNIMKSSPQVTELSIEYAQKPKSLRLILIFDAGLSSFLASYPQIDLHWYFETEPQFPTSDSLITQLRPIVANMPDRDAINVLLHLTQNMFDYKTDQDQFGEEKYLLMDESLYYGINDCEDRSIFLAWIFRKLLNVETIALDYPGHVALAVRTKVQPGDDSIHYQGNKYVVADPTYINADLGTAMPKFKHLEPKVIPVTY